MIVLWDVLRSLKFDFELCSFRHVVWNWYVTKVWRYMYCIHCATSLYMSMYKTIIHIDIDDDSVLKETCWFLRLCWVEVPIFRWISTGNHKAHLQSLRTGTTHESWLNCLVDSRVEAIRRYKIALSSETIGISQLLDQKHWTLFPSQLESGYDEPIQLVVSK